MARRNQAGSLLLPIGLAGAALWWVSRKKKTEPAPTPWPGLGATGWAVNPLCTNADLVDPGTAVAHAKRWRASAMLPPPPGIEQIDAIMRRYFAENFIQCEFPPESILHQDLALPWDGWVSATHNRIEAEKGGPAAGTSPLTDVGIAIALG